MDIRKTKTCEKCKKVVPIDQVRLFPKDDNTNLVVCGPCSEELKKNIKDKNPTLSSKIASLPIPEYTVFLCTRCNYNFRVDKAKVGLTYNLHCPYCGKPDRLKAQR